MRSPSTPSNTTLSNEAEKAETAEKHHLQDYNNRVLNAHRSTPGSMAAAPVAHNAHSSEYEHWTVDDICIDEGCQTSCSDGIEAVVELSDTVTEVFDLVNGVAFAEVIKVAKEAEEKEKSKQTCQDRDDYSYMTDEDSIFNRSDDYKRRKNAKEFLGFIGAVKSDTSKIRTTPSAPSGLWMIDSIPLYLLSGDSSSTNISDEEQSSVNENHKIYTMGGATIKQTPKQRFNRNKYSRPPSVSGSEHSELVTIAESSDEDAHTFEEEDSFLDMKDESITNFSKHHEDQSTTYTGWDTLLDDSVTEHTDVIDGSSYGEDYDESFTNNTEGRDTLLDGSVTVLTDVSEDCNGSVTNNTEGRDTLLDGSVTVLTDVSEDCNGSVTNNTEGRDTLLDGSVTVITDVSEDHNESVIKSTDSHVSSISESVAEQKTSNSEELQNNSGTQKPKSLLVKPSRILSVYDKLYPSDSLFSGLGTEEETLFDFSNSTGKHTVQEPPPSILTNNSNMESTTSILTEKSNFENSSLKEDTLFDFSNSTGKHTVQEPPPSILTNDSNMESTVLTLRRYFENNLLKGASTGNKNLETSRDEESEKADVVDDRCVQEDDEVHQCDDAKENPEGIDSDSTSFRDVGTEDRDSADGENIEENTAAEDGKEDKLGVGVGIVQMDASNNCSEVMPSFNTFPEENHRKAFPKEDNTKALDLPLVNTTPSPCDIMKANINSNIGNKSRRTRRLRQLAKVKTFNQHRQNFLKLQQKAE